MAGISQYLLLPELVERPLPLPFRVGRPLSRCELHDVHEGRLKDLDRERHDAYYRSPRPGPSQRGRSSSDLTAVDSLA